MQFLAGLIGFAAVSAVAAAQTGTWTPDGAAPPDLQYQVSSPSLCRDSARGRLVLFGASVVGVAVDTWEYDGVAWLLRSHIPYPGAPGQDRPVWAGIVHDPVRARTLAVTGSGVAGTPSYTSEWDGQAWSVRDVGGVPNATLTGQWRLAHDLVRQESLCITRTDAASPVSTWVWNGSAWRQRNSAPPFVGPMVFDPSRNEILAVGNGTWSWESTWSWDGIAWRDLGVLPPTNLVTLAADPSRQRVIALRDDASLWEWNGSSYEPIFVAGTTWPHGDPADSMVFDDARGDVVRYHGRFGSPDHGTWLFQELPTRLATFTPFGQGCVGPLGVPTLASSGGTPRLGRMLAMQLTAVPDSPANLALGMLGTNATSWNGTGLPLDLGFVGAPGCTLFLAPAANVLLPLQNQSAAWTFGIPLTAGLSGYGFFAQCAVLVPGWNAGSLVVSNAARGVVGTR